METIQAARAPLEARQSKLDEQAGHPVDHNDDTRGLGGGGCKRVFGQVPDKAQDNFTDPQSRILKTGQGFDPCYNAQAAVDDGSPWIVATEVGNNASDSQCLMPVLKAVPAHTDATPDRGLAEAGYASEAHFQALETQAILACVALAGRGGHVPSRDPDTQPAPHRMAQRMATAEGKEHYRRRKGNPEPVFGWIQQAIGLRTFSVRGPNKVAGEWNRVCLAANPRRMHRLGWQGA